MQAPLQVYAKTLADKAQQQRALQRADAVEADREEAASSEDEEAEMGKAATAQPSADMGYGSGLGKALAASALPLAKKRASRAAAPRTPIPQVGALRETILLPSAMYPPAAQNSIARVAKNRVSKALCAWRTGEQHRRFICPLSSLSCGAACRGWSGGSAV